MPKEYTAIKRNLMSQGHSEKEAKTIASATFYKRYQTTVKRAHDLDKKNKWNNYLIRRGFKRQLKCPYKDCSHVWIARIKNPKVCPKCNRRLKNGKIL